MYEKYRELRDSRNLKDGQVSRETGIARSTFSDWKSGRSCPKQEKLKRLAEYFSVPVSYFSGDETVDLELSELMSIYKKLSQEGKELLMERASELIKLGYIKSNEIGMVEEA